MFMFHGHKFQQTRLPYKKELSANQLFFTQCIFNNQGFAVKKSLEKVVPLF